MQQFGPSITPAHDAATYLVLDEFEDCRVFRETEEAAADREAVIQDIVSGHYKKPVRLIAFNTAEGWARDVTQDIAREIVDTCDPLSKPARDFVERVSDLLPALT
jgi:hypothetical protein